MLEMCFRDGPFQRLIPNVVRMAAIFAMILCGLTLATCGLRSSNGLLIASLDEAQNEQVAADATTQPEPGSECTALADGKAETDDPNLSVRGFGVLEKYCFSCHANDRKYPALDLRDRVTLLRPVDSNESPFLVPGKPNESRIWNVVSAHDPVQMPPADQSQPTAEEKEILKRWIEGGAEFPAPSRPKRTFIGEQTVLAIIDRDLQSQPVTRQPFLRYFSLAHLWNSDVSDEHLRITCAAVSKLMNSLSSKPQIVVPESVKSDGVIDAESVVLRIDLNDYGWRAAKQWLAVSKAYPYGLKVAGETYTRVTRHDSFPYLRADWFVSAASRPPLYHQLFTFPDQFGLPTTQSALERILAVDPVRDYDRDQLQRAAFSGEDSAVSDHNRMVERHQSQFGYYWPSYDFLRDDGPQNLFQFPLGPKRLSRTPDNNFVHDGGELIFRLPNGMQGYMLVTGDGTRLDKGPQDVVKDPNQYAGSYDVVNGISCIGCHRHGMVRFRDTLRAQYEGRTDDVADKVLRIYPTAERMSQFVEDDRSKFLESLDRAIGSFLRRGSDQNKRVDEFPEPITICAKPYDRSVKLVDIARELGLPTDAAVAKSAGLSCSAGELAAAIKFNDSLRRIGLLPVSQGDSLTRKQWETVFGSVAREVGLGTPIAQTKTKVDSTCQMQSGKRRPAFDLNFSFGNGSQSSVWRY